MTEVFQNIRKDTGTNYFGQCSKSPQEMKPNVLRVKSFYGKIKTRHARYVM